MKYLLILLFPILSYSQNIGETFIPTKETKVEYKDFNTYTYESPDSIAIVSTDKDYFIIAIDYIISREKVSQNGLKWLPKQIGDNVYYNGDYYFVLPKKDYFLIQVRNVGKVL